MPGHRPVGTTSPLPLSAVLTRLEQHHGTPDPPVVTDVFEMILWENVAYLASDVRRKEAFSRLRDTVGTRPEEILAAPEQGLIAISKAGMLPRVSAQKMITAARIAHDDFGGDLTVALRGTAPEALKALMRFPGIGAPAAERILLFNRVQPILSLDSNGLRVLCRLGYADLSGSYSETYRAVQRALAPKLPSDYATLIKLHQLLRQHGQEICKRSHPNCRVCPLRDVCQYVRSGAGPTSPANPPRTADGPSGARRPMSRGKGKRHGLGTPRGG